MIYGKNKLVIKKGSFYTNRSRKFVLPILIRSYDKSITTLYNTMSKAAVCINDHTAAKLGNLYKRHLFILVDIEATKEKIVKNQLFEDFSSFMKTLKEHEAYEHDYCYGNNMLMIVLKLPERYTETVASFRKGRYSKMLSIKDIDRIFNRDLDKDTRAILKRDVLIKQKFTEEVKKNFFIDESPEVDWSEFDFPPEMQEEVFNHK